MDEVLQLLEAYERSGRSLGEMPEVCGLALQSVSQEPAAAPRILTLNGHDALLHVSQQDLQTVLNGVKRAKGQPTDETETEDIVPDPG